MTNCEKFFNYFSQHCQIYCPAIKKAQLNNLGSFEELTEIMLNWAENYIEESWGKVLADGYLLLAQYFRAS
jgi:hypothetical protein